LSVRSLVRSLTSGKWPEV